MNKILLAFAMVCSLAFSFNAITEEPNPSEEHKAEQTEHQEKEAEDSTKNKYSCYLTYTLLTAIVIIPRIIFLLYGASYPSARR